MPRKKQTVRSKAKRVRRGTPGRKKTGLRPIPRGMGRLVIALVAGFVFVQLIARPAIGHITNHPIFTVRDVVVHGAEYLDSEKIREAAVEQIGKNIFDVDMLAIAGQLGETYTAEEFTVYKSLPSTIAIRVHERQPVALLNMKTLVGVDKNGVALPHVGADMVATLPIITGISSTADLADSTVQHRLAAGLQLIGKLEDMAPSTYRRLSEINVSSLNALGVSLIDNGLEVIIGDRDWTRKLPVLDRLITEVTTRKDDIKAVDIRLGETVFVK